MPVSNSNAVGLTSFIYFPQLLVPLQHYTLSYLDAPARSAACLTCKGWEQLLRGGNFWINLIQERAFIAKDWEGCDEKVTKFPLPSNIVQIMRAPFSPQLQELVNPDNNNNSNAAPYKKMVKASQCLGKRFFLFLMPKEMTLSKMEKVENFFPNAKIDTGEDTIEPVDPEQSYWILISKSEYAYRLDLNNSMREKLSTTMYQMPKMRECLAALVARFVKDGNRFPQIGLETVSGSMRHYQTLCYERDYDADEENPDSVVMRSYPLYYQEGSEETSRFSKHTPNEKVTFAAKIVSVENNANIVGFNPIFRLPDDESAQNLETWLKNRFANQLFKATLEMTSN